jgi:hypothetical protein
MNRKSAHVCETGQTIRLLASVEAIDFDVAGASRDDHLERTSRADDDPRRPRPRRLADADDQRLLVDDEPARVGCTNSAAYKIRDNSAGPATSCFLPALSLQRRTVRWSPAAHDQACALTLAQPQIPWMTTLREHAPNAPALTAREGKGLNPGRRLARTSRSWAPYSPSQVHRCPRAPRSRHLNNHRKVKGFKTPVPPGNEAFPDMNQSFTLPPA